MVSGPLRVDWKQLTLATLFARWATLMITGRGKQI